jgi:hypothetical protein
LPTFSLDRRFGVSASERRAPSAPDLRTPWRPSAADGLECALLSLFSVRKPKPEENIDMGVFISHVAEDTGIALQMAFLLEQAGYSAWCYELDSIPGVSHIQQTLQAIEESQAFVLLISPACVQSHEVTTELTRAQDLGKVVIPLLYQITHVELMQRRSEWGQRLGNASCLVVDVPDMVMGRLLRSLEFHQVAAGPAPEQRQKRLDAIEIEMARNGVVRNPVAEPARRVPAPVAPPPANGGNGRRFPNAARYLDEVSGFVKTMLEDERLEAQVVANGGMRLVQGRDRPAESWVRFMKKGLGLERAATVKLDSTGNDLTLEVGAGSWTDKAVGGAVGMFVFWPAAVTAGWGVYKQRDLFQRIERDVAAYISGRAA